MLGTACFLPGFWSLQNGRFQANFQAKPLLMKQFFFENVTVLYDRYILFFIPFFSKNIPKREISDRFSEKTQYNRTTLFTKRNGSLCQVQRIVLTGFWKKKRTKREISGRFSGKDPYNGTTIFPKCNGFFMIDTFFFQIFFLSKKEQKVRFQTDFQGKPNIIERQFSQNVMIFYDRYIVLF